MEREGEREYVDGDELDKGKKVVFEFVKEKDLDVEDLTKAKNVGVDELVMRKCVDGDQSVGVDVLQKTKIVDMYKENSEAVDNIENGSWPWET